VGSGSRAVCGISAAASEPQPAPVFSTVSRRRTLALATQRWSAAFAIQRSTRPQPARPDAVETPPPWLDPFQFRYDSRASFSDRLGLCEINLDLSSLPVANQPGRKLSKTPSTMRCRSWRFRRVGGTNARSSSVTTCLGMSRVYASVSRCLDSGRTWAVSVCAHRAWTLVCATHSSAMHSEQNSCARVPPHYG
jgi:hypothetical protein